MPNPKDIANTAPTSPAVHAEELTDASTTILADFSRGIYIGGDGDLVVVMGADHDAGTLTTFVGVKAGSVLPLGISTIHSTTTATDVVAIF